MGKPVRVRRAPKRYESTEEQVMQEELHNSSDQGDTLEVRESRPAVERSPAAKVIKRPKITRSQELTSIQRMLNRTVGALTRKINVLGEEVKRVQESMQVTTNEGKETSVAEVTSLNPIEIRSSCVQETIKDVHPTEDEQKYIIWNVKNINLEKPKFGETAVHPVNFIEDLETYLKKAGKSNNELDLILECLTGNARDWARIYKGRWTGLVDFKLDFLKAYWGENEQNELRRKIVQGVWNRTETPTMVEHFLKLTGKAQMLSYSIPEKQLVGDIMRHYPKFIQQVWATSQIETIIEAAEFLRSMDDIQKQDVPNTVMTRNFKEWEKKKKVHQQGYRQWQRPREAEVHAVNLENNTNFNVNGSEALN